VNKCSNIELGKLLGAYELGMLNDADRAAFELHLFDCEFCCQSYNENEKISLHILNNPTVRDDIKTAAEVSPAPVASKGSFLQSLNRLKWRRPFFIPAAAVMAVALLFFLLRPWHLEFRSSEEAIASGNRLAVIDFKNLTEPGDSLRLGSIISYLLISNLSEVPTIGVVSSERTKDVLNSMDKKGSDIGDLTSAVDFAKKASVRWILYGSLIDKDNKLTLTTQLTDVTTDNVISGQRVSSEPNEDIFSLVDRLTKLTKKDLSLPIMPGGGSLDVKTRITTRSPEAYRYYLEGVEYFQKLYYDDANRCFEKALSFDSTFAMAYYYLAEQKNANLIKQAVKYADNASELERLYIKARALSAYGKYDSSSVILHQLLKKYPDEKYAYYLLGSHELNLFRYDKAIEYYSDAIKIDSLYKIIYNQLMYAYDRIGNFEMALWAINKYIELAPDEANPYDSRGELYLNNGYPEKAIESYRRALAIKPDFYSSIERIGHIYRALGDLQKADSCLQIICSAPSETYRFQGVFDQAMIPYGHGQIDSAVTILDQYLKLNKIDDTANTARSINFLKSFMYQGRRDYNTSLAEMRIGNSAAANDTSGPKHVSDDIYIQLLAQSGQIDSALKTAAEIKTCRERNDKPLFDYWYGMAAIYYQQGNMDSCISYLNKDVADDKGYRCFAPRYWLARAYLESGKLPEAINEFEKQRDRIDCLYLNHSIWKAEIHYYLGIAYEKSNWVDKAIQEYRIFLALFKNADSRVMANYDAKSRLARLEQRP
jgi:tetratricopeptide (TPR) repeat protein/TolB-like protein